MEKTDAETFAGYHDERAFHGGPSFEFHARAATYTRDAAAELDRLRAENAELRARIAQLEDDRMMACETPADDCDCCGCSYAAERHGGL